MSYSSLWPVYQLLHRTYFLPLILIWPLATGVQTIYTNLTPNDRARQAILGPERKCRFRLDTETSAVLKLADGRKFGYAEYGDPNGKPVFNLHGFPGNRLEGAYHDHLGKKYNARIISVDRPGFGWSSPQPGRKVIDHAKDIEQLADHLGLKEYAVMGTSGGGPYALACAKGLPADKLKGVSVVVGKGAPDMTNRGMAWMNWAGWTITTPYFPIFTKWWLSARIQNQLHLDDDYRTKVLDDQYANAKLHPKDAELWQVDAERRKDFLRLHVRGSREAFAQGVENVTQDAIVMVADWGFRIEDIRHDLPIDLWYGRFDRNVAPINGELIAKRLGPNANLRMMDETHDSLQFQHEEEIFRSLMATF